MLVALASVKGSPGVSTLAVALAARWPAPARVVLAEVDPSGGDLAARLRLPATPGLVSLAAAARQDAAHESGVLWRHTQALPGGVSIIPAPADAGRARAALLALTPHRPGAQAGFLRAAAQIPGTVVIADCGRLDAGSPALPIVASATALLLVSRARVEDLAHLPARLPVLGRLSAHPVLLLAGAGYSPAEVAAELGVAPLGRVPEDPGGAAVLSGRAPPRSRWARHGPEHSALGAFAHRIALHLTTHQPTTAPASPPGPDTRHPDSGTSPSMRSTP